MNPGAGNPTPANPAAGGAPQMSAAQSAAGGAPQGGGLSTLQQMLLGGLGMGMMGGHSPVPMGLLGGLGAAGLAGKNNIMQSQGLLGALSRLRGMQQ